MEDKLGVSRSVSVCQQPVCVYVCLLCLRLGKMRSSSLSLREYRVYYNLPSKSDHGRKMTGFITPYRHWMWKQNELWRNVHEAQFEHLRKVYKRQWLESFRVNADEYIYKYNITKAAQLAQWEHEMQAQEAKRRESQQMAHGRQALRKKHLDLLREFHERQFFYWYERASERLQYMSRIPYVAPATVQEHIERELDRYVAGRSEPYPLNFVGQMPMLEDDDGAVVSVPANLMANHTSEQVGTAATAYEPPESTNAATERLMRIMASAQEERLEVSEAEEEGGVSTTDTDDDAATGEAGGREGRSSLHTSRRPDAHTGVGNRDHVSADVEEGSEADSGAVLAEAADLLDAVEREREGGARVARSVEETSDDWAINRRAYIDRGKTGSRALLRRPRGGVAWEAGGGSGTAEGAAAVSPLKPVKGAGRAPGSAPSSPWVKPGSVDSTQLPRRGEISQVRGRVRDKIVLPSLEEMMANPMIASGNTKRPRVPMQELLDKKFRRGKFKDTDPGRRGGGDDDSEDL